MKSWWFHDENILLINIILIKMICLYKSECLEILFPAEYSCYTVIYYTYLEEGIVYQRGFFHNLFV